LAVNVCIVHQLETFALKVIPTISFLCAFIIMAVVWTLLFFNTENFFKNYIFIGVNGLKSLMTYFRSFSRLYEVLLQNVI